MITNCKNIAAGSLAAVLILTMCISSASAGTTSDLSTAAPSDLVNHLIGNSSNIQFSNVTFIGDTISAGFYSDDNDSPEDIGFASGIVLSSGNINGVVGPNTTTNASTSLSLAGDLDLDTIIADPNNPNAPSTQDATVLEFDFVPNGNRIVFQYVFLSEEYNQFVNTSFSDVFGFFVNGVNCALVGDPPVRVSINTINNGNPIGTDPTNPQLYRNNDLNDADPTGGDLGTGMNGLTTILTCEAPVNPNVSNHIKLAIADVGDSALDSNVILNFDSLNVISARPALTVNSPNRVVCTGVRCTVKVSCPATETVNCQDKAVILVRKSFLKGSVSMTRTTIVDVRDIIDGRAGMIRMAAGASNVPPGANGTIKLKLTKKGKAVVAKNRGKRIRGVMMITNSAGTLTSSTPIKMRIK